MSQQETAYRIPNQPEKKQEASLDDDFLSWTTALDVETEI